MWVPAELVTSSLARSHHHCVPRSQAVQINRFALLPHPDQRLPMRILFFFLRRLCAFHVRYRRRSTARQPPPRRTIRQRQCLRRNRRRRRQDGSPLLHIHFFQVGPPHNLHIRIVQRLLSMQEGSDRGVRRRRRIGLRPRIQMRRKHQRSISFAHRQPHARFLFRQLTHPFYAEVDPRLSAFSGREFVQPLPRLVQRLAVNPVLFLPPLLQNHRRRMSTQPQPVQPAESLPQRVQRCRFRHQCIKIQIGPYFHRLGRCHEELSAALPRAPCLHPVQILLQQRVAVIRSYPTCQQYRFALGLQLLVYRSRRRHRVQHHTHHVRAPLR